jgi:tRNA nucleotidyltransferase/poly(A) polymerase
MLNRKWQHISKKTGTKVKPSEYHVENWLNTPFWDSIVQESGIQTKQAQKENIDIKLTPQEKSIFNLLILFKQRGGMNVTIRICGGWVRDHLLGIPDDDMDITLDTMTGAEFVNRLVTFAKELPQYQEAIGKTYLVGQDIEKSKHLETADIDLFGQKVEFVNLRSEEYGETRIPSVQMGTPETDAKRRDLTINSLFYNIETGQIEDYVGGLEDLKTMTLRTPLDPIKTFKDDPLRMLRVLRFFSRYENSTIDPTVIDAMKNPDVQANYNKLAPERASPELLKMMMGKKVAESIKLLLETGLYKKVFALPDNFDITMDQGTPYHNMNLMDHTLGVIEHINRLSIEQNVPDQERGLLNLSALLHDFGKMYPEVRTPRKDGRGWHYIGHEKKSADFADETMTKMGFPQDVKDFVKTIVLEHMKVHDYMNPKKLGKFLHQVDHMYEHIIRHGLADMLAKKDLSPENVKEFTDIYNARLEGAKQYKQEMGDLIHKPLIDGNRIRELLNEIAPDMVTNNAFITDKHNPKPKHFLAFAISKLMDAQWSKEILNIEQVENFIRKNGRNWQGLWKQQQTKQNLPPVQTQLPPEKSSLMNWYKIIKQSDASSPQDPAGFDGYEGRPVAQRLNDIKTVNYYAISPFQMGDKVRLRVPGLAFSAPEGKVVRVGGNELIIEWLSGPNKGKKTKHNLTDAATLSMTLEKVQ